MWRSAFTWIALLAAGGIYAELWALQAAEEAEAMPAEPGAGLSPSDPDAGPGAADRAQSAVL